MIDRCINFEGRAEFEVKYLDTILPNATTRELMIYMDRHENELREKFCYEHCPYGSLCAVKYALGSRN